jgi:hypothetical protein
LKAVEIKVTPIWVLGIKFAVRYILISFKLFNNTFTIVAHFSLL